MGSLDHMSQRQYNQISQHISLTNNLSLSQIESSIGQYNKYIEKLTKELNILERAEHVGIQIRLLNSLAKLDSNEITSDQKRLIDNYDILGLQTQNERFCQELQGKIDDAKSNLGDLIKIKAVFTENYPEAHSSPRLSKRELENSPRRNSDNFKEMTTSPKRSLKSSNDNLNATTASSLMASPRRIKSK